LDASLHWKGPLFVLIAAAMPQPTPDKSSNTTAIGSSWKGLNLYSPIKLLNMRYLKLFLFISCLLLTVAFFLILKERAAMPYNDLGNYYDAEAMINYTDSGIIFYVLSTLFFGSLSLVFAYKWWRQGK